MFRLSQISTHYLFIEFLKNLFYFLNLGVDDAYVFLLKHIGLPIREMWHI